MQHDRRIRLNVLKAARKAQKLTQADAAEALGIGAPHYGRIERGMLSPTAALVDRIVNWAREELDCPESELLIQPSRIYGVPLPSQRYIGRTSEIRMLTSLLSNGQDRASVAIEGAPGIGKTELALQVVDRLAKAGTFPGGIYWFDAQQQDLVSTWAGDEMAARHGVQGETPRDCANRLVRKLSDESEPLLIVLDSLEQWSPDALPAPLPAGIHVTTLVTTRLSGQGGSRFRSLTLEALTADSGRELLLAITGEQVRSQPGVDDLLAVLDGHPLAIELAGVYLREYPESTASDYLQRIQLQPAAEVELHRSYQSLWDRLDDATGHAWRLAACFASQPVGMELSDAVGLDDDGRRRLRRFHLIDRSTTGRWRMHALARRFGRNRERELHAVRQHARRPFIDGCMTLAKQIDHDAEDGYRIYSPDQSHFDEALRLVEEMELVSTEVVDYQTAIASARRSMGNLSEARELNEKALRSALTHFGEDHRVVAELRSRLAGTLEAQGDHQQARELYEQVLSSCLSTEEKDELAIAETRANLAVVAGNLGDRPTARDLLNEALTAMIAQHGERHPDVATTETNLGVVLNELGEYRAALEAHQRALQAYLEHYGESHTLVANARSNLALVRYELGDYREAGALLESACQIDNHEDYRRVSHALRLANLGGVQRDLCDLENARETIERALCVVRKASCEDHWIAIQSWSHLGATVGDLGLLSLSQRILEDSIDRLSELLGADHIFAIAACARLGDVLRDMGKPREAHELLRDYVATEAWTHRALESARSTFAMALGETGDVQEARRLQEEILANRIERSGKCHPRVALISYRLAMLVKAVGDHSEALALTDLSLEAAIAKLGPGHPSVGRTRALRASLLKRTGHVQQSALEAREAVRVVSSQPSGSRYRRHVERLLCE